MSADTQPARLPDDRAQGVDAACEACRLCQGPQLWGIDLDEHDYLVALAGSPNVGKSTVFNALTGMRQHTGNWPGKTVARAEGSYIHDESRYRLVDLPGIYTLITPQAEEIIAHDSLVYGRADVTVLVLDASQLERNMSLALQVLEVTSSVVICLNLIDEANRHGVQIDAAELEQFLGVPVIPTAARYGRGLDELRAAVHAVATGARETKPYRYTESRPELDALLDRVTARIESDYPGVPAARWLGLRLLDGNPPLVEAVRQGDLRELQSPDGEGAPKVIRLDGADNGQRGSQLVAWIADQAAAVPDFYIDVVGLLHERASELTAAVSRRERKLDPGATIDRLLTSRWFGFPLMLLMLAVVFWLTIAGANVPSAMLATLLIDSFHPALKGFGATIGLPAWLNGLLFDGVYLSTAWVISVMLPPMAIFFPLFTLLEDLGYLARVAFNLDALFQRVGAHGKQAMSMSMGFGCNAAGVIATRIIDSPRERLIAIITNNFALCNGRWPTQILIASIFIGALAPPALAGIVAASAVVGVALLGIFLTFVTSYVLSTTVLKGEASTFSLELPPYRKPRLLATLYTSLIDRTIFVLWRAIVFAAPAGAAIWLSANVMIGGASIAAHLISMLDPIGVLIGLNGVILLAYVLAIPANEVVIPTVLMLTVLAGGAVGAGAGTGVIFELDSETAIADLLIGTGGWTLLTAINLMLFSLLHNPCSTTIYTIYKETGSAKWTAVATLLPTFLGLATTLLVAQVWYLLT
ncbi:MAG: ferrous iron transport protein B [Acidobacteria bacterium]|nr:ferrous iron transport protein B [Acidobacteriota bacterium]